MIYLGLFSLLIQGVFLAFFSFSQTLSHAQALAHAQNEASFLIARIAYERDRATSIQQVSSTTMSFIMNDSLVSTLSFANSIPTITYPGQLPTVLFASPDRFSLQEFSIASIMPEDSILTLQGSLITHSGDGKILLLPVDEQWHVPL